MSSEKHKPFFLFRPGFVLFCLYVAAYVWLRSTGEIAMLRSVVSTPGGMETRHQVGVNAASPRWRRQILRAVFSAPMVAEEEGRRHEDTLRALYDTVRGTVDRGGGAAFGGVPAMPAAPQFRPPQQQPQQQYSRHPQQQPPPQGYPPLKEGEQVIYMPTPQEQARQQRFQIVR